ncbi:MAG: transposase [Candidatus Heimdallarchaeum endolithica]|uniref:Transposase n=1 Tax=Candidatus Heimdallarchaeum endolithica TaxID=2876572 RepID=A0A9Y1BQT3_9ARCH|nr:MAG: transposase [Candidatus Heimdallarchaeum endolithica]
MMKKKGSKEWMEKTIRITLLPSKKKEKYLKDAQKKVRELANILIPYKKHVKTGMEFHHLVYKRFRYLGLHSQLQENVQRKVYGAKKVKKFRTLPLEFNFPRSGKIAKTRKDNPVLVVSPLKKRIAFPICRDGGWRRLKEYTIKGWEAHSCRIFQQKRKRKRKAKDRKRSSKVNYGWVAHLNIRKELPPPQEVEGTIGVDVGRKVFAAVTLNHPSFPLLERYMGKDIAWKQHQLAKRRRKLQSYRDKGSKKARRALKKLRMKERKYNKTRCEQIAHEIVDWAVTTRSAIVIENIEGIRSKWKKEKTKRRGKQSKNLLRELNNWPYGFFLSFLTSLAYQHHIPVVKVDPHYTSQTCSRCGHTSKSSRVSRGLYRCVACGIELNSDRNASRNIGLKGFSFLALPFFSSWSSFYPFPREKKNNFLVSVVEERSTSSSGSMSGKFFLPPG